MVHQPYPVASTPGTGMLSSTWGFGERFSRPSGDPAAPVSASSSFGLVPPRDPAAPVSASSSRSEVDSARVGGAREATPTSALSADMLLSLLSQNSLAQGTGVVHQPLPVAPAPGAPMPSAAALGGGSVHHPLPTSGFLSPWVQPAGLFSQPSSAALQPPSEVRPAFASPSSGSPDRPAS